jgi:hypothetical protein
LVVVNDPDGFHALPAVRLFVARSGARRPLVAIVWLG